MWGSRRAKTPWWARQVGGTPGLWGRLMPGNEAGRVSRLLAHYGHAFCLRNLDFYLFLYKNNRRIN